MDGHSKINMLLLEKSTGHISEIFSQVIRKDILGSFVHLLVETDTSGDSFRLTFSL